ncbi:unnamed protein product [Thlaspi arvense]|uniref:Dynamin N-terminal domain-containing protein n=1 Tax=Thlaspi arvense TaxID=13288 RepID=A0AAU9S313_THLAR|nr:unnamed protein product [Thlaspi arvense]
MDSQAEVKSENKCNGDVNIDAKLLGLALEQTPLPLATSHQPPLIMVPLIMRLHHHSSPCPNLRLEFNNKTVHTDDAHIAEAIKDATNEIAGAGKGISNTPLTLIVEKMGVPDLTMIDLPGSQGSLFMANPKISTSKYLQL